jgi:small subunit ribosomal protein S18
MSAYRKRGSRNRYYSRSKVCQFCSDKDLVINYKNTDLLRRYIDDTGKIRPRRQTGACAKHQRAVAKAIKNARHIALLPFSGD